MAAETGRSQEELVTYWTPPCRLNNIFRIIVRSTGPIEFALRGQNKLWFIRLLSNIYVWFYNERRSSKTLADSRFLLIFCGNKRIYADLRPPYTFSGSMSINCNRIPRGGCPQIFLPKHPCHYHRERRKDLPGALERSVSIKIFYFSINPQAGGATTQKFGRWFSCYGRTGVIPITQFHRSK